MARVAAKKNGASARTLADMSRRQSIHTEGPTSRSGQGSSEDEGYSARRALREHMAEATTRQRTVQAIQTATVGRERDRPTVAVRSDAPAATRPPSKNSAPSEQFLDEVTGVDEVALRRLRRARVGGWHERVVVFFISKYKRR